MARPSPFDIQDNNTSSYLEHQDNIRSRKNQTSSESDEELPISVLGLGEARWLQSGQLSFSTEQLLLYSEQTGWSPPYGGYGPDAVYRDTILKLETRKEWKTTLNMSHTREAKAIAQEEYR